MNSDSVSAKYSQPINVSSVKCVAKWNLIVVKNSKRKTQLSKLKKAVERL